MKVLVVGRSITCPLYKTSNFTPTPTPTRTQSKPIIFLQAIHTHLLSFSSSSSSSSSPSSSSSMATCVDSSTSPFSRKPNGSQTDDRSYNYLKFCRPTFSDRVSIPKNHRETNNHTKALRTTTLIDDSESEVDDRVHHVHVHDDENDDDDVDGDDDDLWVKMKEEAKSDVEQEPILSNYYFSSILCHKSLESAISNHLSHKLSSLSLNSTTLFELFMGILESDEEIMASMKEDLRAVKQRDPACISYVHCLLNFKGFLACQAHRIAHKLWIQGRKILALLIQNRVSEVFAVDIHPGAKIGRGILLDHATGLVVGETAVIGNNVSILHNVTLGGTGKASGDRHPKIGDGVLIGAGTCILGNIKIGDGAKIGAGSVVLKEVPPRTTAVGNPAKLIGGKDNPIRLDKIPSFTMDHTSYISEWSDYVI
ncbi:Diamine acetyltransferase 1 [Stylosanthes scabra]|uniref:serine O-acetyltransferase n=1 Tax=Stylosanthes scabra TaxID=79078 RepID=A0ABU6YNS8_9FABA|nr:Diamine acetyltransferase 1 [Stylosanthes scabra]